MEETWIIKLKSKSLNLIFILRPATNTDPLLDLMHVWQVDEKTKQQVGGDSDLGRVIRALCDITKGPFFFRNHTVSGQWTVFSYFRMVTDRLDNNH